MSGTRTDSLPVKAVLLARAGRYFFYEPGIGVIASSENIEAAYKKFDAARREYIAQAESAGLTTAESGPGAPVELRFSARRELALFVAKVCIFLAIAAVVALPVIIGISRSIEQAAAGISSVVSREGVLSFADVARKADDIVRDARSMPEEKKASLRQNIGAISRELAPFVDAWRNPPEMPASPTK